jgi:hypothetical protein
MSMGGPRTLSMGIHQNLKSAKKRRKSTDKTSV